MQYARARSKGGLAATARAALAVRTAGPACSRTSMRGRFEACSEACGGNSTVGTCMAGRRLRHSLHAGLPVPWLAALPAHLGLVLHDFCSSVHCSWLAALQAPVGRQRSKLRTLHGPHALRGRCLAHPAVANRLNRKHLHPAKNLRASGRSSSCGVAASTTAPPLAWGGPHLPRQQRQKLPLWPTLPQPLPESSGTTGRRGTAP